MGIWRWINTGAYMVYYEYRDRGFEQKSRQNYASSLNAGSQSSPSTDQAASGAEPVLYVSWGRIGDAVLATGHLKHFRSAFAGRDVWYVGRSETQTVVESFVDRFIGFRPDDFLADNTQSGGLSELSDRRFFCVIGDIHMFYGGVSVMGALLERLDSGFKFVYEGYCLQPSLAPRRVYPSGYTVIPRRLHPTDSSDSAISERHVSYGTGHYLSAVFAVVGVDADITDFSPEIPPQSEGAGMPAEIDMEPGSYIAWQPLSNNTKKDYHLVGWKSVLHAFPNQTFVALGSEAERVQLNSFVAPNLRNLCGQTSLNQSINLIRNARVFVGLDSSLSHIAAAMGKRTVCVTQSSNLGYFFPYPQEWSNEGLTVVHNPDYTFCSGCFMTCHHEPIWNTVRKGSLCLRTISPDQVIDAINEALASKATKGYE